MPGETLRRRRRRKASTQSAPRLSAVARSSASNPRMIDSTRAASSTDLACTPTRSCVNEIGITPARLTSPCEGAMPTMQVLLAGPRIERPVSVETQGREPDAHRHSRAAAESAGTVARLKGLRIWPPSELSPAELMRKFIEIRLNEDNGAGFLGASRRRARRGLG